MYPNSDSQSNSSSHSCLYLTSYLYLQLGLYSSLHLLSLSTQTHTLTHTYHKHTDIRDHIHIYLPALTRINLQINPYTGILKFKLTFKFELTHRHYHKKPPMCQKPNCAGEQKTVPNGKFGLKVNFGSVIMFNTPKIMICYLFLTRIIKSNMIFINFWHMEIFIDTN